MNQLRERAARLRLAGYSYSMIGEKLGCSKSTLSNWLHNIPFKPNQEVLKKIGKAQLKSALYKQQQKFIDIANGKREAKKDVGVLSPRDMFMLGIGIYLGEGSKSQEEIKIANSSPVIAQLAIKWFMTFCGVSKEHLRASVHGYPDHNINELVGYWSKTLGVPTSQFIKTQIDTRQNKSSAKKRKLPHGTIHIYVRSGGTLHPGVKSRHRKIMGWIEAVVRQI